MSELFERLHLGKHYRIERFAVLFIVITTLLILLFLSINIKHKQETKGVLSTQALYTKNFTMSLTGARGTVENVFTNTDRTKAFVLFKFDDPSKISTQADSYKLFLTGSSYTMDKTDLHIKPSGSIYLFGSTGYMGVYLVESRGFDAQILDLVVRGTTPISGDGNQAKTEETDGSFSKYDQMRVYFNPGATDAIVADILNSDNELKVSDMYEAFITQPEESIMRDELRVQLDTLKLDLDRISEYKERLKTAGIQIPEAPLVIRDDFYTIDDNNTENKDDDIINLSTNHIVQGGVDFNWYDGSIRSGYLKHLTTDSDYSAFLAKRLADSQATPCGDPKICYEPFSVTKIEWRRSDGSLFTANINSSVITSSDKAIAADISNLQAAWQTYYSDKKAYQTEGLFSLLKLEADVKASDSNFTVNTNQDALVLW